MNIVFLIVLTVLLVAVLSFLMPWISKTIEEPFQGSQCVSPSATYKVTLDRASPTRATYVEEGRQRYNFLNFLQLDRDRSAFDGPASAVMGSTDNTPVVGAPTGLQKLNANIKSALETVDILPRSAKYVEPDVTVQRDSQGRFQAIVNNASKYFKDALSKGDLTEESVGYVEERLPPKNTRLEDALKCEANTMATIYNETGTTPGTAVRNPTIRRDGLCALLKPDSRDARIRNAFPTEPNKLCGVCIKDATPANTSISNNGIGGMYVSRGDMNVDKAADRSLRPSYGTCAEGYFFVAGEEGAYDKCIKAAQRLNCEELAGAGGFASSSAQSKDGTGIMESNCRACVSGDTAKYVYFQQTAVQTPQRIRVRVVVPTGTGRTMLKVSSQRAGTSGLSAVGTYTLTSKLATVSQENVSLASVYATTNNTMYFSVEVSPGDKLVFEAAQEFPHRPRGDPEVFFVGFPTNTRTAGAALNLANSLNCEVATVAQILQAQKEGMNVCNIGFAADGKQYIVRSSAISENPIVEGCPIKPNMGGVNEVTDQNATGVWVYGIKPAAGFLETINSSEGEIFARPNVANFYTYYKQQTETNIPPDMRESKYSYKGANGFPNYRGICVQLEQNNSATETTYERINVGVENHIVSVGNTEITNTMQIADRLKFYSRNGRFNDSERIRTPKPTTDGVGIVPINQNQYWLWAPHQGTTQSAKFTFTVEIPAFFYPATHPEDRVICAGALYTNETYLNRALRTVCDNGIDESDSTGCIAYCFAIVGGTVDGTLHPSKSLENRRLLLFKDYDAKDTGKRLRNPRSQVEIVEFLRERYANVAKGVSTRLQGLSDSEKGEAINAASQALFGKNILTPCQQVVEDVLTKAVRIQDIQDIGDLNDGKCLDFLYRNTTGELAPSTYPTMGPSGTYSGLKYPDEYTTALDAEKEAHPYKACQPTGSWAPLETNRPNDRAIQDIKAEMAKSAYASIVGVVARARKVLQDNHLNANATSGVSQADQELALKRCYGITKKTFITNCDGVLTKLLTVYQLSPTVGFLDTQDGWKFIINDDTSTKLVISSTNTTEFTRVPRSITTYTKTGFIGTDFTNFSDIVLDSEKTLAKIRIKSFTTGGAYINNLTVTPVLETSSILSNDYRYTQESLNASEVSFIVCIKDDGYYKLMHIVFSRSKSLQLQVKVTESRYTQLNPFNVKNLWTSAGKFAPSDAPDGVATLDSTGTSTPTKAKGYGIKSLTIIFDDTTIIKPDYNISRGAENRALETIKIMYSPTSTTTQSVMDTSNNKYLVVLRDGDLNAGVAAQKVVTGTNILKFLQEDIRPYIMYESSKITAGTTYRFESAFGKRYFLTSSAEIKEISQNPTTTTELADDASTKFVLRAKNTSLATSDTPINTIESMNSPNNFMIMQTTGSTNSKAIQFGPIGRNTNVDWSIVPALNGAYAFVSIMLANLPGYYLVAEPQTVGTTTTFRARAKLVDPKDDVAAFYACWRLYPAL